MKAKPPPDFFSVQIAEARRFYLDLNPHPTAPLVVVCGGCEHCASNYEIHRADFPFYSLEYVAQGQGRLELKGWDYELAPGTLFSYGPGIAQDITTDPREKLVKYFVDFTGHQAPSLLERHALTVGSVIQTSAPSQVMSIFDELIRNGQHETPLTARMAEVLLEYLLLKIAETAIPYGSSSTPAFATYLRCKQHLQERWLQLHTVQQLAEECHVDPSYVCRLFQRFDHQSPYQCLVRQKINYAAQQLQTPGATIKQIADEVGFSDPFHFSRVFKNVLGISPSQFSRLRRHSP
jgi:AraC-like DNA-binding protein